MIFPENQVRNFYVVTKTLASGTEWADTTPAVGNAKPRKKGNKFYVEYRDANAAGSAADKYKILTDLVDIKNIRDIRLSKPEGFNARTWTVPVTVPAGAADGDTFMLYLELSNLFNFGEGERYFFSYPVVKTSSISSATNLADAFATVIGKALKYNKVLASAFSSVTASSGNLIFTEAPQEFNSLLSFYPHKIKVNITGAAVKSTGATYDYLSTITVGTSAANSRNNGYKVAAMERYFSKVRADLYGWNGYPDVNPSAMITNDSNNDTYYVLDIKYYKQLHGVNVQKSEKELSFASTDPKYLLRLIEDIADMSGDWGDPTYIAANMANNASHAYALV